MPIFLKRLFGLITPEEAEFQRIAKKLNGHFGITVPIKYLSTLDKLEKEGYEVVIDDTPRMWSKLSKEDFYTVFP